MGKFLDDDSAATARGRFLDDAGAPPPVSERGETSGVSLGDTARAATTDPVSPLRRLGAIVGEEAVKTPGRVWDRVKSLPGEAADTLLNPKMETLLPLSLAGPASPAIAAAATGARTAAPAALKYGSTVLSRLGTKAAGAMVDNPSESFTGNLATAGKAVFGDPAHPLSMVLSPAVMEAAVPTIGTLARGAPGAKGRIAAKDAARFGERVGEQVPALGGMRTARDFETMASGQGLDRIGQAKEDAIRAIEYTIGGRPINMPSLGGAVSLREANNALSKAGVLGFSKNPLDRNFGGVDQRLLYKKLANEIRDGIAEAERLFASGTASTAAGMQATAQRRALPPAGGSTAAVGNRWMGAAPIPQREGVERTLDAAAANARGGPYAEVTEPTRLFNTPGGPQRLVNTGAPTALSATPVPPAAPSRALPIWDRAQNQYARGQEILTRIKDPKLYRRYPDEVQFNTPYLQAKMAEPKVRKNVTGDFGEAGYRALTTGSLNRGGEPGTVDILTPLQGHAGDAARSAFGRGRNTGSTQLLGVPLRSALPNIGSQYAGQTPYTMPPLLRAILDAATRETRP